MKKLTYIIPLLILIFSNSCKPDLDYAVHGYTQKIIVEGYISNGEYAKVYLSLNVPVWQTIDSATILDHVIRTAKVTISDGKNTEILTSSWDKEHFPPYVYKTTLLKGEAGKTYNLKIEYSGYTVYSVTTIPQPTDIIQFETRESGENDSLKILSASFIADSTKKCGYRIFSRKQADGFYTETPFVFNAAFSLKGLQTIDLNPFPRSTDPSYSESGCFHIGDTVKIRFATIDSISTQFFNELSLFSSTTGIGNAYFTGEKDSLSSNISYPGFGIWSGSGIKIYQVVIK
ncbi:MAG: hypothetical protein PHH37_03550 [Paludibacter sp.]|nr:hypothetical protein [Paludibacter sp.]